MVKSDYELQLLGECARIACRGFMAGLKEVRAGVTERDVLKAVLTEFVASGAADSPFQGQLMMRSGRERYSMFAARAEDRILREGDQIILDSGPSFRGYLIDMQRQACIGPPSVLQQQLYDRGLVGFRSALAAVRPGAKASDIHRAAVHAMNDHGPPLETHLEFFGHGIGLANHEPPWLRRHGDEVLEEGMVLSIEIPSYDIPQFRVLGGFLEDVVVVTADGHHNLTADVPQELWLA
jgi:Xaa-Pro aminopeptidase